MKPLSRLTLGITGATGFIGRTLIRHATKAGHRVIAFSRDPENATLPGCEEIRRFSPPAALDLSGIDAVVHLAGESVFGLWTTAKRRRILESRREGTRAVVQGIAAQEGSIALISISAVGYYGDTGENAVDEESPSGSGFLAEVCRAWEAEAAKASESGARVAILRLGIVLGEEGGMLAKARPAFRLGLGARLGSGQQWMSWITVEDAARLMLECATNPSATGVYNAVSPNPLRNEEFTLALARRWHRPAPFAIPAVFLRTVLGDFGATLLESQRVLPKRTEELPFAFDASEL